MAHLAYGYRLDADGVMVHRQFDHDDLMHGEAARNGWVDSPDKVPGGLEALKAETARKAATAHTTGREPSAAGRPYGSEPKSGRGQGPRNERGRFVKK